MTSDTLHGRTAIGANGLAINLLRRLVTFRAGNVAVRDVERKTGPVVGKTVGTPVLRRMTRRTVLHAIRLDELAPVRIVLCVAGEALVGRPGENRLRRGRPGFRVAIDALCLLMLADQAKSSADVIERAHVLPSRSPMASLAS